MHHNTAVTILSYPETKKELTLFQNLIIQWMNEKTTQDLVFIDDVHALLFPLGLQTMMNFLRTLKIQPNRPKIMILYPTVTDQKLTSVLYDMATACIWITPLCSGWTSSVHGQVCVSNCLFRL